MVTPIIRARHDAITAQAEWSLPAISPAGDRPDMLMGRMLPNYQARKRTTTKKALNSEFYDRFRYLAYEANISRRLGWKAQEDGPTFIYWRHMPIARFEHRKNFEPHILISAFHVGGHAQPTRALFAMNPLLDYLMTGARLSQKGVEIERRHRIESWPNTSRKPAVYMRVAGRQLGGVPFWEATDYEFVANGPLAFEYGLEYAPIKPFAGPLVRPPDDEPDELDGLI